MSSPSSRSSSCSSGFCGAPPSVAAGQAEDRNSVTYLVPSMDCISEESTIRDALRDVQGIQRLRFELGSRRLAIAAPPQVQRAAVEAIRSAGFETQEMHKDAIPGARSRTESRKHRAEIGAFRLGIALLLAVAAELLDYVAPAAMVYEVIGMALAAAGIVLVGLGVYRKGIASLVHGRLDINALMAVAVTGAFLIGQWPEAAMVMALFSIAEMIEARAVDRARNAIGKLLELAPETAEVRQSDGTWRTVPAVDVLLGDTVRVKPGERVPLDGVVTSGASAVNQAPVTGESIPVDKVEGAPLFAGTINETRTMEFRVTAVAANTVLARIIHAVEEAQGTRAPTQRFVDRFAAVYTPSIFAIALAVALLGPWLAGWSWVEALYRSLVLLVIACPCALVIATPVTVVSGLSAAARRGILIKGGVHLENARNLRAIALDKTGTITEGKPRLVATELFDESTDEAQARQCAADLAGHSDHPVSKAIAQGLALPARDVQGFTALTGRGVEGRVDGRAVALGNHRLVEERGLCSPDLEARLKAHESAGRTVTILVAPEGVLAIFAVADRIKETSREAIASLVRMNVQPVMLTGDNEETARTIAKQAGIDDVRGNLLPEDKLAAIEELQRRRSPTAMTGDGINDAPALARSDMGIAMGAAGTDSAMEAADVVIMNDDLRRIPEAIALSRRTHAVLWQNIVLALGIKAVFLLLAVFGNATMWMAVAADMGASLLVVFNGLRLIRSSGSSAIHRELPLEASAGAGRA